MSFVRRRLLAALAACSILAGTAAPAARVNARPNALDDINNPALLGSLTGAMREKITRNGFVVASPLANPYTTNIEDQAGFGADVMSPYWQFYDLYTYNYHNGIPTFVTTDSLLHTFHVMYDQTLTALERYLFVAKLSSLCQGLIADAQATYKAAPNAALREASRGNMAYLAVARSLLDPGASAPALVAGQVHRELALIAAHRGFALSPIFHFPVDYSQFIPRGHYTGSVGLERYFRAMIWFGRLTFVLNGPDSALRTRQALLLVRSVTRQPALFKQWSAVFDPITTWVGPSDDLTIRDYQAVARGIFPAGLPLNAIAGNTNLAQFRRMANALAGPRINSALVAGSQGTAQVDKGLRLFGQRFVPDAKIMQDLIFPKVGTRRQPRVWPLGLDVAAVLGSSRAVAILKGPLAQGAYAHYADQLQRLRSRFAALPRATWHGNLYWRWLDTLRAVWAPLPSRAPGFMKTPAWADKNVNAGLASWAELRHDTLLYVKQPYGLGAGGPVPPPVAYVEPNPLAYARLLALTLAMKATLDDAGLLDTLPQNSDKLSADLSAGLRPPVPHGESGYRAAIDIFAELVALAQRVSERELLGQAVSTDDMAVFTGIADPLAVVTSFFQDNASGRILRPFDKQVAAIADVFTEPGSGQVQEEGVGDVLPLFVVVQVNGKRWLARGGVYSYYEFHQPMANRLTDQVWRKMPRRPALPSWTASFVAR